MSSRSDQRGKDRDGGYRDDKKNHSDEKIERKAHRDDRKGHREDRRYSLRGDSMEKITDETYSEDKNDRKTYRDDRKGHRDEKRHSLGNETADKIAASTSFSQLFSDADCRVIERKIDEVVAAGANGEYKPCTVDKTPLRNKYFFGEGYIYGGQLKVRGPGNEKLYPKGKVDEIPSWIMDLVVDPIVNAGMVKADWINSAVINDYLPGGHIVSHIDPPQLFDRPIITASFLSDSALSFGCRFSFRPLHVTEPVYSLPLTRGGVVSFEGFAADEITHCIRPEDTRYRRAVIILRHVPETAPRLSLEEYHDHMAAEEAKKRGFDNSRSYPDLITSHRRPQENWYRGRSRRSRSRGRRSRSPRRRSPRKRSYSLERSNSRSRSRSRGGSRSRTRSHSRHRRHSRSRSSSRRRRTSRSKSLSRSSSPSSRRVVLLPGSQVKVKPSVPGFVATAGEKVEKENEETLEGIEEREEIEFQKRLEKLKARGKQLEEVYIDEEVVEINGKTGEIVGKMNRKSEMFGEGVNGDEVIDIQIEEREVTDEEEEEPLEKLKGNLDRGSVKEEEVSGNADQNENLDSEDKDLKNEVKELKEELRELKDFIKNIQNGSDPSSMFENNVEEGELKDVTDMHGEEEVQEEDGEKNDGSESSGESTVNAVDIIAQEIKESIESKERKNTQAKNTLKMNAEKKQKLLQAKLLELKRERRDKRVENDKRQKEKQDKVFEKLKEKEKFSFKKSTSKTLRRKRKRSSSSSSASSNEDKPKRKKSESSTTSLIDVLMNKIKEKAAAENVENKKLKMESERKAEKSSSSLTKKMYEEDFPAAYRSQGRKAESLKKEKDKGKAGRRSPPHARRAKGVSPHDRYRERKRNRSPKKETKERKRSPSREDDSKLRERSYKERAKSPQDEGSSKRKFKNYHEKEMERGKSREREGRKERKERERVFKERAKSPQDEGSSKRKSRKDSEMSEEIEPKKRKFKEGSQNTKASQHKVTDKSDQNHENSFSIDHEKEGKVKKKSLSELISTKLSGPSKKTEDFASNRRITVDDSEKSYGDFSKLTINVSM